MLDDAVGFAGRVLLQIFFEAIFEGIFYGLKKLWFAVSGQTPKAQAAKDRHQLNKQARRMRVEQIRQTRRRRKNGKADG